MISTFIPSRYHHHHHHHHVAQSARIFRILSRHTSLSSIAFGRSSGLHPVSAQNCCMLVRAGRPAFARPCEGVHRSTSFTSLSLLLQQCPACLVHLTWILSVMSGWWPYSWWLNTPFQKIPMSGCLTRQQQVFTWLVFCCRSHSWVLVSPAVKSRTLYYISKASNSL